MSRIRGKDTAPEVTLREKLWARGLRYRKDVKRLPGKPDIVFVRAKVSVFVDGRFWHGKKLTEDRLCKMSAYWQEKIRKNVARDVRNNHLLTEAGYVVLRFTDVDVLKNADEIATRIEHAVRTRTSQ